MADRTNFKGATPMDHTVQDCFEALLTAIRSSADDWRRRAQDALRKHDDAKAEECMCAVRNINEKAAEVDSLLRAWRGKDVKVGPGPTGKGRGSRLRVHLEGEVIEYPTAAETFARTIARVGAERVMDLGMWLSGSPLVATAKAAGYQSQFEADGFFVCTHSNTRAKKRLLEEIAQKLGLAMRAEVIEP